MVDNFTPLLVHVHDRRAGRTVRCAAVPQELLLPGIACAVSEGGRVFVRRAGRVAWSELKPYFAETRAGGPRYLRVDLVRPSERRRLRVHVAVFRAWHGPLPRGQVVRHLDDDRANCAFWNLAAGTPAQNAADGRLNREMRACMRLLENRPVRATRLSEAA